MQKLIRDFKEFAIKGNMIDIAIGVIIGAAFNKVVDTLVKEVIMPPLSMLTNQVHWGDEKWVLKDAVIENGRVVEEGIAIGYGHLIETSLDFLIIAITVFVMVRFIHTLKKKAEDPANKKVPTPKNIELLNEMTQLLREQNELLKKQ